jgi:hypothetical protein
MPEPSWHHEVTEQILPTEINELEETLDTVSSFNFPLEYERKHLTSGVRGCASTFSKSVDCDVRPD